MKPKQKFTLHLKIPQDVKESSSFTSTPTQKKQKRHNSQHQEKENRKKMDAKKKEIEEAVAYCRENNCKGYKAISDLNLQYCKDPRTINAHLERDYEAGKKRQMLTEQEEKSLVRFLINKNRACQGLNENQIAGVVLNILRVRKENNRRLLHGGWDKKTPLSNAAKQALEKNYVGHSFFRRLRAAHPELKPKNRHKVSVKRGLRCTEDMAIEYLDELAKLLIEVGIAPDLKQKSPGIWEGKVDVSRIWAHDETPQFINFNASGQSKKKIYAGSGDDCAELAKENRESVTVQPFSNFAGELTMVQVVFAGAGFTSHMCPKSAAGKIPNLLISVNQHGCSTGDTLYSAYKELFATVISPRRQPGKEDEAHVIIADGHKSRFDLQVLKFSEEIRLEQFILWSDTSGATQNVF